MFEKERREWYLQLFADNGDNGDGGGTGGDEPTSFDDFLKLEGNQAEFDRRIQKAINTAVSNAKEKWQLLADEKLTEAEKLAKMNKEERALYKAKKAQEELEALKAQMATAELGKEARKLLKEEGVDVPDELSNLLVRENAEKTNQAVKEFTQLFKQAVGIAVKSKARQGTPPDGRNGTHNGKTSLADMAKKARII